MWHSLPERGHILARAWALGWEARPRVRISDPTHGRRYFQFRGAETVFFVKQLQGAHLSIARDLCAVIGDRLHTTYHMPYARASHLGIPTASCGVPPNPLETGQILTRGTLSVAQ